MVASQHVPLSVVGDEDSAKRRQVLDGARKVFLDLGFDGASMGEIARAAGVSKGTLYVYFTDKSALFEAIVEQEKLEQGKAVFNLDPERDAVTTLGEFGRAYIQLLCRPGGGSAIRTVMAIAERMPDVDARVEAKELKIDNTELAAAQFMMSCQATLFQPFIFQAKPTPTREEIDKVIDSAVRMFLAAYRV
jgi:AcrR family transcriptional regulator